MKHLLPITDTQATQILSKASARRLAVMIEPVRLQVGKDRASVLPDIFNIIQEAQFNQLGMQGYDPDTGNCCEGLMGVVSMDITSRDPFDLPDVGGFQLP